MATLRRWNTGSKGSLFDRLQNDQPRLKGDAAFILSVKNNLRHIFNARPGECHGTKELGIIDVNDALLSTEEIQSSICQSIRHCIARYEPRISQTQVVVRQDPITFTYYFSVIAQIAQVYDVERIELDIHINNNKLEVI
ncbi:type VI secretion system baseplate subunit TssE [Budviciaceae bacterium CWB-B4]|uniref:Type VI secretion system baseplate subunit TssE n=2 Tax=Limnobaculum TaxID=2172100 RepID=A0A9D7AG97_9GAMM|nr:MULTISPECIES: type VI secretion system baseplate subunit TssE [Limnobaculum]MBK5072169.1 type VI secretion system baseplate subunit TssE [Limnobaculum xujianqingii]MBK5175478.1 type VI secretion system baseplate subunit TssE [Limnobaculum xujianqingii]QBH97034.1 type VI secretion system baseplate subunit TssE [Limnobaculum zhutongyuii]TQS87416.1 type VI secretion system baseplate subunit TssE [Limnobaculum zhutongyuii]